MRRQNVAMDVDQSERRSQANVNIGGNQYRMQLRPPTSQFASSIVERNYHSVVPTEAGSWTGYSNFHGRFASHFPHMRGHEYPWSERGPVRTGERNPDDPVQSEWFNRNLGWVMTNNGVGNNRAAVYGPEDPLQRGDRNRYRYVHSIYTMFRTWMRRAIDRWLYRRKRVPEMLAKSNIGPYNVAAGGATQRVFTRYSEQADAEYRRRLSDVTGITAYNGKSYGNTINANVDKDGVPLRRSERLAAQEEPDDLRHWVRRATAALVPKRPKNWAREWGYFA